MERREGRKENFEPVNALYPGDLLSRGTIKHRQRRESGDLRIVNPTAKPWTANALVDAILHLFERGDQRGHDSVDLRVPKCQRICGIF